jgi:ethanolamine ammonia-lyase small subunit
VAPGSTDRVWLRFKDLTRARIGLGRAGDALPTQRLLEFAEAHGAARDAVYGRADFGALAAQLRPLESVQVHSAALDRATYLRRPDLGRRLAAECLARLPAGPFDVVFVVADGLSASAAQHQAAGLLHALLPQLAGWRIGPVVLAAQARVALGDEIAAAMNASMVVVLIGERPGLTVPNSLGIYLTQAPRVGRRDSERNCISNVHGDGLTQGLAAEKLAWLMKQSRLLGFSGVALKEDAPLALAAPEVPSEAPQPLQLKANHDGPP